MAFPDTTSQQAVRMSFRYVNQWMVLLWRLGLGTWLNKMPRFAGRYMVLVHTGRKSGLKRETPVNFAEIDGEIYCAAGFGTISDWYRNIITNPGVEVWLPDGWWAGSAEDITSHPESLQRMRAVLVASGFAGPMFGVDPLQSDDDLKKITTGYRLIHIRRTEARTGTGGPGDMSWIWPATTFLLAFLWLLLPRKRK
jgi:deazaflavin-dependent oxidoreductase (nitroreductase family)